jgi:hypothetical protein
MVILSLDVYTCMNIGEVLVAAVTPWGFGSCGKKNVTA